jgi:hypothetical protein
MHDHATECLLFYTIQSFVDLALAHSNRLLLPTKKGGLDIRPEFHIALFYDSTKSEK